MTALANAIRDPFANLAAIFADTSDDVRFGGEVIMTRREIKRQGYRRENVMGETRWVAFSKA